VLASTSHRHHHSAAKVWRYHHSAAKGVALLIRDTSGTKVTFFPSQAWETLLEQFPPGLLDFKIG